ncbi:hypothetical protein LXL04_024866 [Taraxacum kok-saghyz]
MVRENEEGWRVVDRNRYRGEKQRPRMAEENYREMPAPKRCEEVDRIASSFFVTNLPKLLLPKELWQRCQTLGSVVDKKLCEEWFGNYHIFVSKPRPRSNNGKGFQMGQKTSTGESIRKETHLVQAGKTYAKVVSGEKRRSPVSEIPKTRMVDIGDNELTGVTGSDCIVIADVRDATFIPNLINLCREEVFKKVAAKWGNVLFSDDDEANSLAAGKVCVQTKQMTFIHELIKMVVKGITYDVYVKEMSLWELDIGEEGSCFGSEAGSQSSSEGKQSEEEVENFNEEFVHDTFHERYKDGYVHEVSSEPDYTTKGERGWDFHDMTRDREGNRKTGTNNAAQDVVMEVADNDFGRNETEKMEDRNNEASNEKVVGGGSVQYNKRSQGPGGSKDSGSHGTRRAWNTGTWEVLRRKVLSHDKLGIYELNTYVALGKALGYNVDIPLQDLKKRLDGKSEETRMTKVELFKIRSMWGNNNFDFACSTARLYSGILSVWDNTMFVREAILCTDNAVIVEGRWVRKNIRCTMINVYAPEDNGKKKELWAFLLLTMRRVGGMCILMGDFNVVRTAAERLGSVFCATSAEAFNDFVYSAGVADIPLGGRRFTRVDRSGAKMSRLDRFLVSESSLDVVPGLQCVALIRKWSDHHSLLLKEESFDYGTFPFKLFNSWLEVDGFEEVVKSAAEAFLPRHSDLKSVIFKSKFKFIKNRIRNWIRDKRPQQVEEKKKMVDTLGDIDVMIDDGQVSSEVMNERSRLLQSVHEMEKRDVMDCIQKTKVKWAVEGDENSAFSGISVDVRIPRFKCLTEESVVRLQQEFTMEEVKAAVWACGGDRAPGPDGFTFKFLKHFWDLFKEDVWEWVKEFYVSGEFGPGCNSSFITLISKVDNPTNIKDYRPISLIGIQYIIIAKLLAIRLAGVIGEIVSTEQSGFIKGKQILDGPVMVNEIVKWAKKSKYNMMMFKVDFEKAYYSLSWDFLDRMMEFMGCGDKWRIWIKGCLVSARASVLVNGSPTAEFQLQREKQKTFPTPNAPLDAQQIVPASAVRKVVGDGCLIKFWYEVWLGEELLCAKFHRLFALSVNRECLVSDCWSDNGWRFVWRRNIRSGVEEQQLRELMGLLHSVQIGLRPDRWSWSMFSTGEYSVASVRAAVDLAMLPSTGVVTRVAMNRLPVREVLVGKGIDVESLMCPVCDTCSKSVTHMFFHCPVAQQVWRRVLLWLDVSPSFADYREMVEWVDLQPTVQNRRTIIDVVFGTLIWVLWTYRNAKVFGDTRFRKDQLFDSIVNFSFNWVSSRNHRVTKNWNLWKQHPLM